MKAAGVSLQPDSQWLEQSRKCRNIITAQFGARRVILSAQQYQDKVSKLAIKGRKSMAQRDGAQVTMFWSLAGEVVF